MKLEILRGSEQYCPENLVTKPEATAAKAQGAHDSTETAMPEPGRFYSELYSNKHEKLLLRADHVDRMDAIRRNFNKQRIHEGRRALTTSDIVNAALDFVFEHPIPFHRLADAEALRELIAEHVYRDVVSRWRQWTERF